MIMKIESHYRDHIGSLTNSINRLEEQLNEITLQSQNFQKI